MTTNKRILVTGASSDIGASICQTLKATGAFVIAQGNRNMDRIPDVDVCLHFNADSESVEQFVENVDGELDAFVNVMGKTGYAFAKQMRTVDWEHVLNLNLTVPTRIARLLLPRIRSNGSFVFISSVLAQRGEPGMSHYSAAKAGIEGFVRSLAVECGPLGIRVNAIAPHLIDTRNTASIPESKRIEYIIQNPLGRMGEPSDVSGVVAFLLSEAAAYITGQIITVDGGSGL